MSESPSDPVILFYCRHCKIAFPNAERVGTAYQYRCPQCKSEDMAFGTQQAIAEFYHIKEAALKRMLEGSSAE